MKRFLKSVAILVVFLLAVAGQAAAGTLVIDWTTSTSTTTSGDTIFQISAISGTYSPDIKVGDMVIPNLSNYTGVYSVQPISIGFGTGLTYATMGGVTFQFVAQFSNVNDATHWSGATEYVLNPVGTAVSGASLYVLPGIGADKGFDFMRLLLREALRAVSPFGTFTVRSTHK